MVQILQTGRRVQRWHGFIARRYGPKARYTVPRMPRLYWQIEGRAFFKSIRVSTALIAAKASGKE